MKHRNLMPEVGEMLDAGAGRKAIAAFSISRRPNMAQAGEMPARLGPLGLGDSPPPRSDQGWRYRQRGCRPKLKEPGSTQSTPRKATRLDNACMEGFSAI